MAKEKNEIVFKTLLTRKEYDRLAKVYEDKPSNLQVNYYFDTSRFTLKASEITLRVRKKDTLELNLRRKKGYNKVEINQEITEQDLENFINHGMIPSLEIQSELNDLMKNQALINFMTFNTFRIFTQYRRGNIAIDKCEYLGETDYELEFDCTNYEHGKEDFIELLKEYGIGYKKAETKMQRAYSALRRI